MPHIESNIPQSIFYSSLVGEFLRIARSSLLYCDFLTKARDLLNRMENQGAKKHFCNKALTKIVNRHREDFFGKCTKDILADFAL